MLALRFYIDKKKGSEHSRMIDVAETDEDKARAKVEKALKKGETINSVVSISIDFPDEYELI
jgi:hypothetical protein